MAVATDLRIGVRNGGDRALPGVSVTIDSFDAVDSDPALANPRKPAWVVDRSPGGGAGSDPRTWTLGPLAPGASLTFVWHVTPVRPGRYTVFYRVAPAGGGGAFTVTVSGAPADTRVDPRTGRVVTRPVAHL